MTWLQEKYINLASSSLQNFTKKGDSLYNFRCPFCGDSKKNKKKSRGYLYDTDNDYHFKCHNCQTTATFDYFLHKVNQSLFKDYKFDIIRESGNMPEYKEKKKEEPKEQEEILLDKILSRCSNLPRIHPAIKYLNSRDIPKDKFSELFYLDSIEDVNNISDRYKQRLEDIKLKNTESIFFPLYNRQKRLVGMNIRLIHSTPNFRYITLKTGEDDMLVFGLDKVSFNKNMFVLEGPFDSLFFNNAIALVGSSFNKLLRYVKKEHSYFIFDNQPRNKEVVKNYSDYCEMGYKVFMWPDDYSDSKDINDLIQSGKVKPEELEQFIMDNSYSGLELKLRIAKWKV